MSEQKIKGRNSIGIHVKPSEYDAIYGNFKKTTCCTLSEYARNVLLNRPVTIKYRNQSADDFLNEMVKLKNELNAIGSNYKQSVKRLQTMDWIPEIKIWLLLNESTKRAFMTKTDEIKERMNQLYELWSQK